jgi:hypothetical protein
MTGSQGTFPDDSGSRDGRRDDSVEARLHRALTTEAAMVQPAGDGLQKIRTGIDERRGRAWWQRPAVALVAAAVLGLAVGGLYFGLRDEDGSTVVASTDETRSPSETPSASASSPPATASASPSEAGSSGTAYVYYIHDDGQSPRLYREQHTTVGGGPQAAAALRAMFRGQPDDPDYASPWDNTRLVDYAASGDTATVDLSGFVSLGAELETVAVQEIVYTVTANDPAVKRVRLLVLGKAPKGHSDWSEPVRRAPMVDVQGLVWLLAPTQDATVGSPVRIEGFGTAFEGTISWQVRKDGKVVKDGSTQGGANGDLAEFSDTVDLPAGTYEISAFESSAEDGSPVHIDTKNFTVK